jgi:hypothetical protein
MIVMDGLYRQRVGELINKISPNGVLELTMEDMCPGTKLETAERTDIRYSLEPIARAAIVILVDEGRIKILKARNGVY